MSAWPADHVERRPLAELIPYAKNARTHSDEQVAQLAGSIREFGWTMPVLLDEAGTIIAGHGRVLAAQRLGLEDVPCMTARGWTDAQVRAYRIADNRLALNAGWDDGLLRLELGDLRAASFDLGLIGFSEAEIAGLLADGSARPARITPPHHAAHDIRVIVGDCRDVLPTLPADSVHCVVTSPPYYGLRDYGVAGQIGLEATPEEWLATMIAVFREVRRVLRDDGTCWVNVGDSYAASSYGSGGGWAKAPAVDGIMRNNRSLMDQPFKVNHGAKPKDLLMMPARLALALQADGWWLRSDIIWAKPNPMPESVTDRPTNAHEHVFLLTKSARYFYDADAVREAVQEWNTPTGRENAAGIESQRAVERERVGKLVGGHAWKVAYNNPAGRNLRNVWTIATAPFPEAHFATFPPELAERCIKAGTSEAGCCAACGAPWVRETSTSYTDAHRGMVGNQIKAVTDDLVRHAGRENDKRLDKNVSTIGWQPGCKCAAAEPRPCLVLDPFAGSGTTLLVADQLQCDAIGIELNSDYIDLAKRRAGAQEQAAAE